jgi:hypothetical protein
MSKLLIILYLVILNIYSIIANNSFDFRFISYNGMYLWQLQFCFFILNKSYFILESLENTKIYQNGDEAFDAITIDLQKDEIIIGAK